MLCYSVSYFDPQGSSHCTEAEGEGGWQTEAVRAPVDAIHMAVFRVVWKMFLHYC